MSAQRPMEGLVCALRAVAVDRAGNILIMFTFMLFGLALLIGAAVDFSRAVALRSNLQNAADAAALAGVADFTSLGRAEYQQAVASNYMNANVAMMAANDGVDFTITPFPTKVDGMITAFNIRVSATGRLNTTFLSLLIATIPVSAESTATIPATVIIDAGSGAGMPALLLSGDNPNLFVRPRNLEVQALGMGIGQEHITQ